MCCFLPVFEGGGQDSGTKGEFCTISSHFRKNWCFPPLRIAVLHIIYLVMIIVYNSHNSDNLQKQLQISNSFLFLVQISFDVIRKLSLHVPPYLPLHNLIARYQSQTFDKKKGDAPMSEYADSDLTVAPLFFLCT